MDLQLKSRARSALKDSMLEDIDDDDEGTPHSYIARPFALKDALLKHTEDEYEHDEWNPFVHAREFDYHCGRLYRLKERNATVWIPFSKCNYLRAVHCI